MRKRVHSGWCKISPINYWNKRDSTMYQFEEYLKKRPAMKKRPAGDFKIDDEWPDAFEDEETKKKALRKR